MARILIQAIVNGEENLAKKIIESEPYVGEDKNTTSNVDAALFLCCCRGFLELAKLLLNKGANVAFTDQNRTTSLHGAVDNGHLHIVRLLLSCGANANAQNIRGDTPLHLAAFRGFGEIARCLLDAKADCRLVNSNTFTAENEAIVHGHNDLGTYLRYRNNESNSSLKENIEQPIETMINLDYPSSTSTSSSSSDCQENLYKKDNNSLQSKNEHNSFNNSYNMAINKDNDNQFVETDMSEYIRPVTRTSEGTISYKGSDTLKSSSSFVIQTGTNISQQQTNYINQINKQFLDTYRSSPRFSSSSTSPTPPALKCELTSGIKSCEPSFRRDSTSSISSCFSDFSTCSGSDSFNYLNSRSCGNSIFNDLTHEDHDYQDTKLHKSYLEDSDNENLWLSLGVKNPPSQKYTAHLSEQPGAIRSAEFSAYCDSTVYSLRSLRRYPSSLGIGRPSTDSLGLKFNGKTNGCKDRPFLERDNNKPREPRPLSSNLVSPQHTKPKVCHAYDENYHVAANVFSSQFNDTDPGLFCQSLDKMPSNDLSSPFSLMEKSSISMTSVNIPFT